MTTLAPDIVAPILDEALPPDVTPFDLAVDPQVLWTSSAHSWSWGMLVTGRGQQRRAD